MENISAQGASREVLNERGLGRSEFDVLLSEVAYTEKQIDRQFDCLIYENDPQKEERKKIVEKLWGR